IATEREPAARELGSAGEAMQHERECPLGGLFFEDACNVAVGLAGMDHKRKPGLTRSRDMGVEALLLIRPWAIVVMKVETCLSDRHHFGMAGELHEVGDCNVHLLGRIVRMCANRAENVVVRFGNGEHLLEAAHPRRYGDHEADTRGAAAREHRMKLPLE